jgi:hypothetical protein
MPSSAPTGGGFIAKERANTGGFCRKLPRQALGPDRVARQSWQELRISATVGILRYGSAKNSCYFAAGVINVGFIPSSKGYERFGAISQRASEPFAGVDQALDHGAEERTIAGGRLDRHGIDQVFVAGIAGEIQE